MVFIIAQALFTAKLEKMKLITCAFFPSLVVPNHPFCFEGGWTVLITVTGPGRINPQLEGRLFPFRILVFRPLGQGQSSTAIASSETQKRHEDFRHFLGQNGRYITTSKDKPGPRYSYLQANTNVARWRSFPLMLGMAWCVIGWLSSFLSCQERRLANSPLVEWYFFLPWEINTLAQPLTGARPFLEEIVG